MLRRLEFHYVPKHASWLNMVEIEIGVLARQCLDRRIDSYARLRAETAAWEKRRNADRARIKWMFTTKKARAKIAHSCPGEVSAPVAKATEPSNRAAATADRASFFIRELLSLPRLLTFD